MAAKETNFDHPPRGHVAILFYDPTNDRFQAVQGDDVDTAIPAAAKSLLASSLAHGYDGSAWQKLALLWGYSDTWRQRVLDLTADEGSNTLVSTAVPAGEVWTLENVMVLNANTACTYIRVYVLSGGQAYIFAHFNSPAANVPDSYAGRFTLAEGDVISVLFTGCTANDDIYVDILGRKMAIDM